MNGMVYDRFLTVAIMIGSFITSIRYVNAFTSSSSRLFSVTSRRRRFLSSMTSPSAQLSTSNLHFRGGKALFMSSIATLALAAANINESINSTECQPVEHNIVTFPEDALIHDTYNGVTINISKLPSEFTAHNALQFLVTLSHSLQLWKEDGKKGIWIHVPTEHSIVIPKCVELGFEFQHAKNGLLVLTRWLPEDQPSRLPHGPTHQLGVGVIVIHPLTKKILVVQEKTGPAAKSKLWKMPTGLLDPGEDVIDAAVREAKEETGLDCVFDKILCMRQAHGGIFNQSDMFIVCALKLASKYHDSLSNGEGIQFIPQEEEIANISWMDVDEFADQDLWQKSPLYKELNGSIQKLVKSMDDSNESSDCSHHGLIAKTLPLGYKTGEQTVYLSSL